MSDAAGDKPRRGWLSGPHQQIADLVLVVMVGVWAFSQIFAAFVTSYDAPEGLHQLIMVICGFLFGHRMGANGSGNGVKGTH